MEGKYFTCEVHKQNFPTVDALKQHVFLDHSNEGQLKCQACNKQFKSALQFERHKSKHDEPIQSGKKNRNPQNLNQDVPNTSTESIVSSHDELMQGNSTITIIPEVKVEAETSFQCHICSTFFAGESTLSQHLLLHLEDRSLFTSGDLAYEASSNIKLENIVIDLVKESSRLQKDVKPTVDNNGQQITGRKLRGSDGVTSFRRQTKAIGFICHLCTKTFKTRSARKKHVSIEHSDHHLSNDEDEDYRPSDEEDPIPSSEEDMDYEIENDLRSSSSERLEDDHDSSTSNKEHMFSKHSTEQAKISRRKGTARGGKVMPECYFCRKTFKPDSWNLESHIRCHTMERPFQCPVNGCKKSFPYKVGVRQHLVYHSEERAFKCNLCERRFLDKKTLTDHLVTHSDERNHVCKTCKKSFKRQKDVNRHIRSVHSKQNRFKCNFCCKGFYRKDVYDLHMKLHELQGPVLKRDTNLEQNDGLLRPYPCNLCKKRYRVKMSLKFHMQSVHFNTKSFKCKFCSKTYSRKDVCNQHMKIKHSL